MTPLKKILIVDDHPFYREGLKLMINKTVDMIASDEAENGQIALQKISDQFFDLVILDISLPGRSGLDVLADIKRVRPKLPVLILTMHPEEQYAIRAFKGGASGYINKACSCQELHEALRKISLGKRYITPALAEVLADNLTGGSEKTLHEKLSAREYQIMCQISIGRKPHQIAEELAMSIKTVGTYRERILKKMCMKSNAELTRYVLENGL